jgi:hypothetical protein
MKPNQEKALYLAKRLLLRGEIEFSSLCRGWFLAKDVCIP